jgi:hypothetical protein
MRYRRVHCQRARYWRVRFPRLPHDGGRKGLVEPQHFVEFSGVGLADERMREGHLQCLLSTQRSAHQFHLLIMWSDSDMTACWLTLADA